MTDNHVKTDSHWKKDNGNCDSFPHVTLHRSGVVRVVDGRVVTDGGWSVGRELGGGGLLVVVVGGWVGGGDIKCEEYKCKVTVWRGEVGGGGGKESAMVRGRRREFFLVIVDWGKGQGGNWDGWRGKGR